MKDMMRFDLSPKLLTVCTIILFHTFIHLLFPFFSITNLLNFILPSFNNQPSPG